MTPNPRPLKWLRGGVETIRPYLVRWYRDSHASAVYCRSKNMPVAEAEYLERAQEYFDVINAHWDLFEDYVSEQERKTWQGTLMAELHHEEPELPPPPKVTREIVSCDKRKTACRGILEGTATEGILQARTAYAISCLKCGEISCEAYSSFHVAGIGTYVRAEDGNNSVYILIREVRE